MGTALPDDVTRLPTPAMIGFLARDRSFPRQRVEEDAKPLLETIEIGLASYVRSRTVIRTGSNFQARHRVSLSGEMSVASPDFARDACCQFPDLPSTASCHGRDCLERFPIGAAAGRTLSTLANRSRPTPRLHSATCWSRQQPNGRSSTSRVFKCRTW